MSTERPSFVPPGHSVVRKLGSGQTSNVYLSRHGRLGEVALKLPRDDIKDRPVLKRMFENEVQITLGLHNAFVVQAVEGFPTGNHAFLVLEYCPGGTLDQLLLEKSRLELGQAVRLILDVAQGLWHCHQRQVLHRDVKPANVFLSAEGQAKLGDFGTGIFLTDSKRLKERVGTAFYMAPEIFEGKPADVQSDIYSLGVLAYEVLAGERPFLGDSYDEVMIQHLTSLPRNLKNIRSDIPPELHQVVVQAMSRDPGKRFQNVGAFIRAFDKTSGVQPQDTQPAMSTGRGSRVSSPETAEPKTETAKKEERRGPFGWFKRKK